MGRTAQDRYGLVAVVFHWLSAGLVVALFGLGLWMVELTYYDPWYQLAPWTHKGLGISLLILTLLRLGWRLVDPVPPPLQSHSGLAERLSRWTHALLYLLLLAVMTSGYLISTADGRGIPVFDLFELPALITGLPNQADVAGRIHLVLAVTLIALAALHALAALKHHFLDRDATLMRILGRPGRGAPPSHARSPR